MRLMLLEKRQNTTAVLKVFIPVKAMKSARGLGLYSAPSPLGCTISTLMSSLVDNVELWSHEYSW
jgi:hypothetical protein